MKLSIRAKIIIAFLSLVIVGASIWFFSDYRNYVLNQKFNLITEKNILLNTILEARRYEKNYFLYYNLIDIEEAIRYSKKSEKLMEEIIRTYEGNIGNKFFPENLSVLRKYKESLVALKNFHNTFHGRDDFSPEKKHRFVEKLQNLKYQKAIRQIGKKITDDLELMVNRELVIVNKMVKKSRLYLLIGSIAVFVLCTLVALFLYFSVNRPLKNIAIAVKKIAKGDYEFIRSLKTGDEFDSLINSLNTMISELEKRNEQLIQSRKMASLGTLTSGVAHELNNPLNNISTSIQIVLEELADGDTDHNKELLIDAEKQIDRARDIVKALLEFSRESKFKHKLVQLKTLIDQTVKLIKGDLPTSIELNIDIPEDIHVYLDFRQMEQVLINILMNAIHAVGKKGKVYLRAFTLPTKTEACIEIQDTGTGISQKNIDKIFDPFFTTKEVGKGSGLGLSISHGIIQNHEGRIEVESEEGKGSKFSIFLPIRTIREGDQWKTKSNAYWL
ncbi:MAG: HAMP domain-containing protein [Deltaproteobacteria bacterium]|nr:HAMP domain-containing protein [Deltaproteobacteria bacterium]